MEVLISGINGFLGKSIASYFVGHKVYGLGRSNADYSLDLSITIPSFTDNFDLVIHCAGKAHFNPQTEEEVNDFFNVNVTGTANILLGLELNSLPKFFVYISSVSVYGLVSGRDISENSPLLAVDPYGRSKILAEELVIKWCQKNNVKYTILRLPLLVGNNPLGNLSEMISAIKGNYYFNISGGQARKSMVLVTDVSRYILKASETGGIYNLTDGYHPNFNELSHHIAKQVSKKFIPNLPFFSVRISALIGDKIWKNFPINSIKLTKIISTLTFDDSKARKAFGWDPKPVLKEFKIYE
ncbi:NAD-dependent epimerase/dehydratase family protein [Aquirufa antheringensis]